MCFAGGCVKFRPGKKHAISPHMINKKVAIGLMSGTSLDGIDAVLIETDGAKDVSFLESHYVPYDAAFRNRLHLASTSDMLAVWDFLLLEKEFTERHTQAVKQLLEKAKRKAEDVDVIGFHGQTLRHLPAQGLTWQIGDGQLLAQQTGITTVCDFRRADMAQGGQGAPLAALYHQALFAEGSCFSKPLGVINIGGVGNVTYLAENQEILAGDTGPGIGLLDMWVQEKTDKLYDEDGTLAAAGRVDEAIVQKAMAHAFFQKPLPKSADKHDFSGLDLNRLSVEDGAATLVGFTVESIAYACQNHLPQMPETLWVCGGGAKHPILMEGLRQKGFTVKPVEQAGFRTDTLEAECFAWLAVKRLQNQPTSLPQTTGCSRPTSGGMVCRV